MMLDSKMLMKRWEDGRCERQFIEISSFARWQFKIVFTKTQFSVLVITINFQIRIATHTEYTDHFKSPRSIHDLCKFSRVSSVRIQQFLWQFFPEDWSEECMTDDNSKKCVASCLPSRNHSSGRWKTWTFPIRLLSSVVYLKQTFRIKRSLPSIMTTLLKRSLPPSFPTS